MSKTETQDRAEDEVLDENGEEVAEEDASSQPVVSDRRARRKAKRGEAFITVDEANTPNTTGATTEKKGRPTASRRTASKQGTTQQRNILQRIPIVRPIYNYLDASLNEMRKVTWPTREETVRLTRMVLVLTILASVILGTIDVFYGWWFRQALDNETLFLGLAVIVGGLGLAFTYFVFVRRDQYNPYKA